ncbi:hypothetical protein BMBphi_gp078 [Bacillus phage vB_BthS_BMBphi]|nr:hypothetical protein BMBphi_gp078 [Bacillus phage vB_BthS_BMBphi]
MRTKHIKGYVNKYVIYEDGRVWSMATNRFLKPSRVKKGYLTVGLYLNGKETKKYLHRLVAEAFIPNKERKPQVNHIDGNKLNNHRSNLEWCTNAENVSHAFEVGLMEGLKGSKNNSSKLKETDILEIIDLLKLFTQREVASMYDVSQKTISLVSRKISWKHSHESENIPDKIPN